MFALPFCHGFAAPRRIDGAIFAAGVAAVALAAIASLPPLRGTILPASPPAAGHVVITLQHPRASLCQLRDEAEIVRARLLALPGIGAVRLHGLLTTGLEVDYAPARLARLGVTPGDLRAAVPAEAQGTVGRLVLSPQAVQDGPQPIADRLVQAAGHSFRLGDIATVSRVAIAPVSVLSRDGQPAVALEIVPAPGTDAESLDRRLALRLDGMAPEGVRLQ